MEFCKQLELFHKSSKALRFIIIISSEIDCVWEWCIRLNRFGVVIASLDYSTHICDSNSNNLLILFDILVKIGSHWDTNIIPGIDLNNSAALVIDRLNNVSRCIARASLVDELNLFVCCWRKNINSIKGAHEVWLGKKYLWAYPNSHSEFRWYTWHIGRALNCQAFTFTWVSASKFQMIHWLSAIGLTSTIILRAFLCLSWLVESHVRKRVIWAASVAEITSLSS